MMTLRVNRGLNELFDNFLDPYWEAGETFGLAGSSFDETDDNHELTLNLAGFKKKNIKISARDGFLFVSAEQEEKKYNKSISLPEKADPSLTAVKYEDGLLRIVIRKREEEKPIDIKVG